MSDQKGFLEEIQSLDESTKKRVLIISTIIIMIIVIGVWFAYFNSIVGVMSQGSVLQATTTAPVTIAVVTTPAATSSASGPGLWQNVENGFSLISRSIAGIFSRPSNYTIKPQ